VALPCKDCGIHTAGIEYYMVHDTVWKKAGMDRGCLCLTCLETRLGRPLVKADFPPYPINTSQYQFTHGREPSKKIIKLLQLTQEKYYV
jgi:hypothetical protein